MGLPLKHVALVVAVALAVLVGGVLYPMWRTAVDQNRDARADPYHIAGGLYFVGAPDVTSFLLVGDKGHALIGAGFPNTPKKIIDNVEQLGFEIKDVRMLLATDPHDDEAGGLAGLQQETGAELWASDANASVMASGGADDPSNASLPRTLLGWAGVLTYPPPRVDHRVHDGQTINLGSLAITAHLTPGHSPGCTTWTFTVRDADRDLDVVHRCSLDVPDGSPEQRSAAGEELEQSVRTLRQLPVDIWLTSHGREYGRFRKYQESLAAKDPVEPFIDPKGYREALDRAEANFRTRVADRQRK